MLRYVGVSAERAARLRELADLGCSIHLERVEGPGDPHHCVLTLGERRSEGRGEGADEAVVAALADWDGPA